VGLEQNRSINELHCYGNISLANWTSDRVYLMMSEPNGLANHGHLRMWTDEFTLDGSVANYGYFQIKDIEFKGNIVNKAEGLLEFEDALIFGDLHNQAAGQVHINENIDMPGGALVNEGLMLITPSGEIWAQDGFHNTGSIQMYLGQCLTSSFFKNTSGGRIKGTGIIHSDELIENEGIIHAQGGGLVFHSWGTIANTGILANSAGSTISIQPSLGELVNQGTVQVNSHGSMTLDCNFVSDSNGTVLLRGGTLEATVIVQQADANFAGFGGITGDVLIDPNGLIELTGPTNIVGDLTIDPNATLEISDGTTLITGHTTCNNGTIHMIGGRVICQGGLTNNNCNIIWEPGTYTNMADFNLDGTVNFKDFADFADTWLWKANWYTP
ncbi:MAG: hypothetical protein ACYTEO_14815, partial [Planctomycetota bacterium]